MRMLPVSIGTPKNSDVPETGLHILFFMFSLYLGSKSYLVKGTHKVLITIQNCVDELNKFTMYFQNRLHKLSWHLKKRQDNTESKLLRKGIFSIHKHSYSYTGCIPFLTIPSDTS